MYMIKEDKLGTILLDFNNELNEEYLKTFGYKVGQFSDGNWFMEKTPAGRNEL